MVLISHYPTPPAVLVHATPFNDRYIFSCVSSTGHHESGKHVIVSMQQDGWWHCESCHYSEACKHKPHAITFAAESGLSSCSPIVHFLNDDENLLMRKAAVCSDGLVGQQSISHLPIPPPRWCMLPHESLLSSTAVSCTVNHFLLDETSRCTCGLSLLGATAITTQPPVTREAFIFGLTQQRPVTIELLLCPVCCHSCHYLGPDLSKYGVFNWNNTMLFSHKLVNAYTNAYMASETLFSAFCLTT